MSVLIIGETERARIAEVVAEAKARPIPMEVLRAGAVPNDMPSVMLKDRKPGFERPPSAHVFLPGGYRAALSFEHQPPGLCSHLSISVFGRARKGMMPSPEAAAVIAHEFGVPFPPDMHWVEEFDPGEFAINLLSLYAPAPEGSA